MGVVGILGSTDIALSDLGGITTIRNTSSHASHYNHFVILASRSCSTKQLPDTTYPYRIGYADDVSISARNPHPCLNTRYAANESPCEYPASKNR